MSDETDGMTVADWREALPAEVKAWQETTTAKDADGFWDQMSNMRSLVGRGLYQPSEGAGEQAEADWMAKVVEQTKGRMIPVPSESDPAAMAAYNKALGVPEDADGYTIELPEGAPEGFLPDGRSKAMREAAHRAGIPPKQFSALARDVLAMDLDGHRAQLAKVEGEQAKLREEWGETLEARYKKIEGLLAKIPNVSEDLRQAAANRSLPADAAQLFYYMASSVGGEGAEIAGQQGGGKSLESPGDAVAKIEEIMSNPEYWDKRSSRQPGLQRERMRLENVVARAKRRA